jgi:Ca2+-binding RTX toxin-like protein
LAGGHHVVASWNLAGGNDTLSGGTGNDTIIGDNSVVIAAEASVSQMQVNGSIGNDHGHGGDGYHDSSESGSMVVVRGVIITGGNDVIDGGAGNDTIIGDSSVVITEQVSLSSSVENVTVGDPAGLTDVQPGFDLVSGISVTGGDDQIQGGAGSDLIAGDNSMVIAPVVNATQNVVFQDSATVPVQLAAPGSESHKFDPSYFVQRGLLDDLVSGVTVTGGNDVIGGGDGNSLLFGADPDRHLHRGRPRRAGLGRRSRLPRPVRGAARWPQARPGARRHVQRRRGHGVRRRWQ